VFTLGSHSPFDTGEFFAKSIDAAGLLGCRAVLLGAGAPSVLARRGSAALARRIVAFDYAPYSAVFPRAAAIVHHGGIGTIALALQAGRPMLLVPQGFDQPDNSLRTARLGCARVLPPHRYTPTRAGGELWRLLSDPRFALAARALQRELAREDGVGSACDALETYMGLAA
jgi:rhamnosyltransferase subunit B